MTAIELLQEFRIYDYVLTFFVLSIIGWIVETTYCSLANRRFINRGFLTGPLCPIYGTGALVFMVTLTPFSEHWYTVLFLGMVLADVVEYITSFLMEKLFHARWWDYSEQFLNINGRICLKHTCYWGLAAIVYIYLFQPAYLKIYLQIPEKIRVIVLAAILVIFVLDLINAVKNAIDVRKFMNRLKSFSDSVTAARDDIKNRLAESKESVGSKFIDLFTSLSGQLDDFRANNSPKGEKRKDRANRIYTVYDSLQKTTERSINYTEEILQEIKKRITDEEEEMF